MANLILGDAAAAAKMSAIELAESAHVSQATVIRFCQLIGFEGYPAMRDLLASEITWAQAASLLAEVPGEVDLSQDDAAVLGALIHTQIGAVKSAGQLADVTAIGRVADMIASSSRIDVCGMGASGTMAVAACERLRDIGLNAYAWNDLHRGLSSAARTGPGAVVIGLSNSGATYEVLRVVAKARERGAFTVGVTSDAASPLAQLADEVVLTFDPRVAGGVGDVAAQASQLFIVDLLYLLVVKRDPARARENWQLAREALAEQSAAMPREPRRRGN